MSKEKEQKKIKSFIYLDDYKMYSISSQIFEGLTESITSYSRNNNQEIESQKGEYGSGRLLADIINKESSTEERKFLYDYSYSLFEEKLLQDGRVILIDSHTISEMSSIIINYDFIRVKGRLLFNDINMINQTIEHINSLGEACVYVQSYNLETHKFEDIDDQLNQRKNNKSFIPNSSNEKRFREIAKQQGLYIDQLFLDKIKHILNYAYGNQIEAKIYLENLEINEKYLFSSLIKREYLRESENLIVQKYSRYSEKEFVIFGIITQCQELTPSLSLGKLNNIENMKENLTQFMQELSNHLEKPFFGRGKNEIIIDPIAIYREL